MTKDINNTHTAPEANAPSAQPDEWVRRAMERFLDGTTTVDEEQRLAAYFAQAKGLTGEWLMYRDMFAYMGEGMPMGQLPEFDGTDGASPSASHVAPSAPVAKVPYARRRLVWMGGMVAAAAVAALLVVVGMGHGSQADMGQGMVATLPAIDGRPVVADTVAAPAKGASDVAPDQKEATDAMPGAPASRRKRPAKVRRHRYDIVAPKTYYAKVDTPSVADIGRLMAEQQRQIDDENRYVEREIQETLTLIDQVREQLMANDSDNDTEEVY